MVIAQNVKNLTPECTLSLAWISLSFLRANTWICDETCFRVLVLPVRNLMYRAISSFLPGKNKWTRKILEIFLKKRLEKKIYENMYPHESLWDGHILVSENITFKISTLRNVAAMVHIRLDM